MFIPMQKVSDNVVIEPFASIDRDIVIEEGTHWFQCNHTFRNTNR